MSKRTKEECERDPEGHEYAMIYNDGTTRMNCGEHRQLFAAPDGKLLPAPNKIDRAFVLRLYAIHELIMDAAHDLNAALMSLPLSRANAAALTPIANKLDYQTDRLELVFAEVLSDEDRNIPSDDKTRDIVREALGVETNEEAAEVIRREIERRKEVDV